MLISFRSDDDDKFLQDSLNFKMNDIEVYFDFGDICEPTEIHPDLIGLATILLCNPFVGNELFLPLPVSKHFLRSAQSVVTRYKISSKWDPEISRVSKTSDCFPGLAFSGGADSSAALAIMPSETIPIFLNRPIIEGSLYNSNAPISICEELIEVGYDVKMIPTNLEFIREPVGFPTDLANAIPAILLSEKLSLDSLSFGTVMESGFGIGHEKFVDYARGAHWKFYSTIFSSVGIELSMPVIGISEVGTAIIGETSPMGNYSQSCIRGDWKSPCLKCWKCFRKELLTFSLGFGEAPDILKMLKSNEVQYKLSSFPISHENVIAFSLQRIDLDEHPYLKPLADKIDLTLDLSLLETWYPGSIDFVPRKHRHKIREKILSILPVMSPGQESVLSNWDMSEHLNSKRAKGAQEKLTSFWQDIAVRFGQ